MRALDEKAPAFCTIFPDLSNGATLGVQNLRKLIEIEAWFQKDRFGHELGRHASYGRNSTGVLHEIASPIQQCYSQGPKPKKVHQDLRKTIRFRFRFCFCRASDAGHNLGACHHARALSPKFA